MLVRIMKKIENRKSRWTVPLTIARPQGHQHAHQAGPLDLRQGVQLRDLLVVDKLVLLLGHVQLAHDDVTGIGQRLSYRLGNTELIKITIWDDYDGEEENL